MKQFLSCDWGTSSFRLRLVNTDDFKIIAEVKDNNGIAATFAAWQQTGQPEDRVSFYLDVIKKHIGNIEQKINASLAGVQVIISGMASSTIGFFEIPYSPLPVAIDGAGIKTVSVADGQQFEHDVLVISGLCSEDDVVRGEETQLIGCIDPSAGQIDGELFIFPGTHSKHLLVKADQITAIKTYMTGEVFELLSQKSILRLSVQSSYNLDIPEDTDAFKKGVRDAAADNLLHTVFKVRTNSLLNKLSGKENFNYLSGLLIGTELKDLQTIGLERINLLGGSNLIEYYRNALAELGLLAKTSIINASVADEAVIYGQYKIYKKTKYE